jgi:hypothetical protein
MGVITFDIAKFRERFPEFADESIYTNGLLTGNWDVACCYVTPEKYGCLTAHCREQAILLMTAHITKLQTLINSGQNPALLTSATIDKVSVSAAPPPVESQFEWWCSLTGYGQQLWALLTLWAVGGTYSGGAPVRSAYRKFDGRF